MTKFRPSMDHLRFENRLRLQYGLRFNYVNGFDPEQNMLTIEAREEDLLKPITYVPFIVQRELELHAQLFPAHAYAKIIYRPRPVELFSNMELDRELAV